MSTKFPLKKCDLLTLYNYLFLKINLVVLTHLTNKYELLLKPATILSYRAFAMRHFGAHLIYLWLRYRLRCGLWRDLAEAPDLVEVLE